MPASAVQPLTHAGRERPYLLHVPPSAGTGATASLPLVLELHGRGVSATEFDGWTRFGALADEAGFALALPSAVAEVWNDGRPGAAGEGPDDLGYLLAVMDDVGARAPVDQGRIYVVGMSNGAAMAGQLALLHAKRVAAVAQVAATAWAATFPGPPPDAPVPILHIHGSADPSWPYEGGTGGDLRRRLTFPRRPASVAVDDCWAAFWVAANGAAPAPETGAIGRDVSVRTWRGPSPASDVVIYRIAGGGHPWPAATSCHASPSGSS